MFSLYLSSIFCLFFGASLYSSNEEIQLLIKHKDMIHNKKTSQEQVLVRTYYKELLQILNLRNRHSTHTKSNTYELMRQCLNGREQSLPEENKETLASAAVGHLIILEENEKLQRAIECNQGILTCAKKHIPQVAGIYAENNKYISENLPL